MQWQNSLDIGVAYARHTCELAHKPPGDNGCDSYPGPFGQQDCGCLYKPPRRSQVSLSAQTGKPYSPTGTEEPGRKALPTTPGSPSPVVSPSLSLGGCLSCLQHGSSWLRLHPGASSWLVSGPTSDSSCSRLPLGSSHPPFPLGLLCWTFFFRPSPVPHPPPEPPPSSELFSCCQSYVIFIVSPVT